MLFPWVGIFEQVRLADVFVHYDDVQLPQGRSFITRVQLKTPAGPQWMTLPVLKPRLLANIDEIVVDDDRDWRKSHLALLRQLYRTAPFCDDMLALVEEVYKFGDTNLAIINSRGVERVAQYFELDCIFRKSSELNVPGKSSERLLAIVQTLGGSTYITGHGARNYLSHELFETHDVRVEYMRYEQQPYAQLYGAFTPFVSILDLIANLGRDGRKMLASSTVHWKEFLT